MSDHIDPLGIIWLIGHVLVYLIVIPDLWRRCGWGRQKRAKDE